MIHTTYRVTCDKCCRREHEELDDTPEGVVESARLAGWGRRVVQNGSMWAGVAPTRVVGDRNETGVARIQKFLARVPHRFVVRNIGNAATPDQLKKVLGL